MKRFLLVGLWACCCLLGFGQADDNSSLSFDLSDTNYERVYALCIGISEYEHFDTLHYASKDAASFSQTLEALYPEAIIKTLTDKQVSETEVYISLTPFRNEATNGDLLVFFFSGHGAVENTISVSNLILPTTPKHLYFTDAINLKELGDFLLEKPKEDRPSILVIIDACRKGETENLEKTYNDIQSIFKNQATILLACEAGKESIEDGKLQQGVFTHFLLEAIDKCPEDQDRTTNYQLELDELSRYLTNTVRSHTKEKQIPQVIGNMSSVVFSCNTLSEPVSVKNAFVSPQDISQLQQDNNDPLHLFNEFSRVLKEGKEAEAKAVYNKMPDSEEAKTLKEVMREKLLDRFSTSATSMLKSYIENGLDTLSLSACNEVVIDLEYCLSLIDTSYFRYNKFKGRTLFFQGIEKKIEKDYFSSLALLHESLIYIPKSAFVYYELANINISMNDYEVARYNLEYTLTLASNWNLPQSLILILDKIVAISTVQDNKNNKNIALLICNSNYTHLEDLPFGIQETKKLELVLKDIGFHVLAGYNLDRYGIKKLIYEYLYQTQNYTQGLVVFSGHVLQGIEGHFLPNDTPFSNDYFSFQNEYLNLFAIDIPKIIKRIDEGYLATAVILDVVISNDSSVKYLDAFNTDLKRESTGNSIVIVSENTVPNKIINGSFTEYFTEALIQNKCVDEAIYFIRNQTSDIKLSIFNQLKKNICFNKSIEDNLQSKVEPLKKYPTIIITPNNDGWNEVLTIYSESIIGLLITNRWGVVVYKSNYYQQDWAGQSMSGQPLPEGTYYYTFNNIEKKTIGHGTVVIKR